MFNCRVRNHNKIVVETELIRSLRNMVIMGNQPDMILLNNPGATTDVSLKLEFKFSSPIEPNGTEIVNIKSALNRNPVERVNLGAKVSY